MAAPSQAAALKAWGARGDLFARGEAFVVTASELTAEPLARLGEVIRRPRGDMATMLAAAAKPTLSAMAAEKLASARVDVRLNPHRRPTEAPWTRRRGR